MRVKVTEQGLVIPQELLEGIQEVEVVFTSGGERKLTRYKALGVPEVWFWEDGVLKMYQLQESGYEGITRSHVLPNLDINLLSRCLMIASKVEATREFRRGISA